MATITGLTADRMQQIIDKTIVSANIVGGHLILTLSDGSTVDAGVAQGPTGPSGIAKVTAFPASPADGDMVMRTDQAGDPVYKYTTAGGWALFAGGLAKVTSFPVAPADGDGVVRTDLNGSPIFMYSTENGWEQLPRMGAVTTPQVRAGLAADLSLASASQTPIQWTSEIHDTDGMHGTSNAALTGTMATTSGSKTVTGSGTSFTTQLKVGDAIFIQTGIAGSWINGEFAVVASITSNTSLTVSYPLQTTSSGVTGRFAPEIIVFRTPGRYLIHCKLQMSPNASGRRSFEIGKNGIYPNYTSLMLAEATPNAVGANSQVEGTIVDTFAALDFIVVSPYQNSGGALTVSSTVSAGSGTSQSRSYIEATWQGGVGQTVDERGVPAVGVFPSASQSIPTSVATIVTFDSEVFDTEAMHDTVTNTSRITFKTSGLYHIRGQIALPSGSNSPETFIRVNGNNNNRIGDTGASPSTNTTILPVSAHFLAAAGDYVELVAYHEAGSSKLLQGAEQGVGSMARTCLTASLIASGKTVTPFARVSKSANQSFANGVQAVISWDTETSDNDSIHDIVNNNSRLTAFTAGVYAITGWVTWGVNGSGQRNIWIRKNGAATLSTLSSPAVSTDADYTRQEVMTLVEMAVGDYVEMLGYQTSGAAINVNNGDASSGFAMVKVGAPIAGQTSVDPIESWHIIGSAGEPAFANGWTNLGAGNQVAAYRIDRKRVWLRGLITAGTIGSVAFTLPAGYRPAITNVLTALSADAVNTKVGRVDVQSTGNITPTAPASNNWVSLDGLSFAID